MGWKPKNARHLKKPSVVFLLGSLFVAGAANGTVCCLNGNKTVVLIK